jgi:hypothetical protein
MLIVKSKEDQREIYRLDIHAEVPIRRVGTIGQRIEDIRYEPAGITGMPEVDDQINEVR